MIKVTIAQQTVTKGNNSMVVRIKCIKVPCENYYMFKVISDGQILPKKMQGNQVCILDTRDGQHHTSVCLVSRQA